MIRTLDPAILMIVVYAILGIVVATLLSILAVRKRRGSRMHSVPHNTQAPTSVAERTHLIQGRYEVKLPPYKQGGMAAIWLAVDRKTGRVCVIKTPRRGTSMDNVYLDKLMLEARYLKKLKHPGIVKYLDDFYYNGEFHLVIEYVNGQTVLTSSPRTSLKEPEVIAWAAQMLDALSYLHTAGIVHRDVNPKNIMLCDDGSVKLIDFGTAKSLNDRDREKARRDPFTQIANRGFDIPELFMGEKATSVPTYVGLRRLVYTC